MTDVGEVYYRIYYLNKTDKITIVCMQDFDEYDYQQESFLKDKQGNKLKFMTEGDAKKWLYNNVKPEKIDPEYLQQGQFNQEDYLK